MYRHTQIIPPTPPCVFSQVDQADLQLPIRAVSLVLSKQVCATVPGSFTSIVKALVWISRSMWLGPLYKLGS